jgi:hypothetical protein
LSTCTTTEELTDMTDQHERRFRYGNRELLADIARVAVATALAMLGAWWLWHRA